MVGAEGKECTNRTALKFASSAARANTTPTLVGGIVGAIDKSTVSYCTNYGTIETCCNSTTLQSGGIAAVVDGEASVTHCTNEESGTIIRTSQKFDDDQTNRYIYMGGCIGEIIKATTISYLVNKAAITSNQNGKAKQTSVLLGGVVGDNKANGLEISNCSNGGKIYWLKRTREIYGITQERLSAKSGVPIRLIRAYEQGKINMSNAEYGTIMKLRNALNCA